ncbi:MULTISPECIES: hypothetical protein [Streptomyces]|jgi:hypothetical protein|uniref:hypothetical protein n=1 Tax=Streptomyces TaxID=1883 RepID=UPI00269E832B
MSEKPGHQQGWWAPLSGEREGRSVICPRMCGGLLTAQPAGPLIHWTCQNPGCGYHIHS